MRTLHFLWRGLGAAALVAALTLCSGTGWAALDETSVMESINDSLAVMHGFFRQLDEIEANLDIVRASRELTERQYEAQKKLYETEKASGSPERAAKFKDRLDRLERQMKKLKEFDFEKIYSTRADTIRMGIKDAELELDARVQEYKTLFGKAPVVDMSFKKELEARKGVRKDLGYFLRLD